MFYLLTYLLTYYAQTGSRNMAKTTNEFAVPVFLFDFNAIYGRIYHRLADKNCFRLVGFFKWRPPPSWVFKILKC